MKTHCVLNFLWLAILGMFLGFSSSAYASDNPQLDDARALLEKAWNPTGDAPSDADRTALLKSAMELLKKAPRGPYRGHLQQAINFIQSALYEIEKGDPDHKATDYIHSAVDEVRDIT